MIEFTPGLEYQITEVLSSTRRNKLLSSNNIIRAHLVLFNHQRHM